jgi:N-acetylmuramoyl-L-alanine amidase
MLVMHHAIRLSVFVLLMLAPAVMAAPVAKSSTKAAPTATTAAGKSSEGSASKASNEKPSAPAKTAPGAAPRRVGWKIIESRGLAYVDMEDVAAFFRFNSYKRDGVRVFLSRTNSPNEPDIEWRAQTGSKLVSLNKMRLYLSYPVVSGSGGKALLSAFDLIHVIDPILRPEQQRDGSRLQVVVIDAARGGHEDGISTNSGREKDITLDVAMRLKPLLERAGYRVFLTREGDIDLDVTERLMLANSQTDEAVFISLHCSHGNEHERGIETFTLSPSGTPSTTGDEDRMPDQKFYPGNINDRESMALATAIQGTVVNELKAMDLGVRRARFDELKGIAMPAVVCSVGRLAHPEEGKKLGSDAAYRQRVAHALCEGIHRYARVMAAGRSTRERLLKFAGVTIFPDKVRSLTGEQLRVRAIIAKTNPTAVIDPRKVTLQVYFLDFVNNEEIDLSTCDTPQANWISVIPNWQDANYEEVEFTYQQPAFDNTMLKSLGRRTYYGFVLRLVYDGELMDEHAEPSNLRRGIGNFTAVLPRYR